MPGPRVAYIDESGDIGLGPRSSKFFVVGATVTDKPEALDRIVKKARRSLGVKERKRAELKFSKSSHVLRRRVLRSYNHSDAMFIWFAIQKDQFHDDDARSRRRVLHMGYHQVLAAVTDGSGMNCRRVFIDSRKESWMDELLTSEGLYPHRIGGDRSTPTSGVVTTRADSTRLAGLQITDFAVGAVYQMLENGNPEYYDLIWDRVHLGRTIA